jgi:hypothetical protein
MIKSLIAAYREEALRLLQRMSLSATQPDRNKLVADIMDRMWTDDDLFLDGLDLHIRWHHEVENRVVNIYGSTVYGNLVRFDNWESIRANADMFKQVIYGVGRRYRYMPRGIETGEFIGLLKTSMNISDHFWVIHQDRSENVTHQCLEYAALIVPEIMEDTR